MIIIQTESGAIVTDPKEIYIDKDLDGHLHIYADLSSTDRVKAVELTAIQLMIIRRQSWTRHSIICAGIWTSGFSRTNPDTTSFVWTT